MILPDAASSPRWENGDRPALEEAITSAGFEVDIQNAQGDTAKYATIAEQQMTSGCDVMLLVDLQGAAVTVTENAQAEGIPVIAYDRPIAGADYYVSFDNFHVGELQGQCIVDGLDAAGVDGASATVVYIGGDPADGNAAMFHDGADSIMAAAGVVPAKEPDGAWDGDISATNMEQALTSLDGKVDAVWAANDTNAAGVITVLDKNGLVVPVSGQDASVAGLQNILLGKQACTVYKPYQVEAASASELAIALLNGESPTTEMTLDDGTPFIASEPINITPANVQQVIDDGNISYDELCAGDVKAACDEAGLTPAA
ncbi:sugar ABC transporter substrate-binding protein [Demequina aurantiaca]|uniref:sugar ABC transporter substrate-binding protein n=1 Tax=Demequina aurantiaca TaxID=676200 RepID=UPI003D33A2D0